jgi:hypothetical protein
MSDNGCTFASLEHLNAVTARWLAETADIRVHRETQARPIDRHAEERPHLIPLPATPFEVAAVEYRVVDVEGFIVYRQNRYSVPWRYSRAHDAIAKPSDAVDRRRPVAPRLDDAGAALGDRG